MHISKWAPCMIVILLCTSGNFIVAGNKQLDNPTVKGKEALHEGVKANNFSFLEMRPDISICIEECIRRNQMASVGGTTIEEPCRSECNFESTLALLKSPKKEDYERGVKDLSEMNDPRAVQPLIIALRRDLKERSGLWAWIIPALGALGDPSAVPVLTHTLTLNDDSWLGREMSVRALGSIGDPSSIPQLLVAALRADTRDDAIDALGHFQDKRTIPVFLSALNQQENKQTREAAINGLHLLGSIAIPEMLEAFCYFSSEHPETSKRLVLCHLLGTSGDKRAVRMLQKSIADPDKIIKQCAEEFLQAQK